MLTRREFVGAVGSAASVICLPPAAYRIRPAAYRAPLDRIAKVGLQLYTVRGEMRKDVAATIARVAEVGYKEVEFAGYFDLAPEKIRELLDANGLTSPSAHFGMGDVEGGFAATAAAAKVVGHQTLIVASLPTRQLQTVADWKEMAARFNAAGKRAHDAGMRFGFHNHDAEFTPVEGAKPFDILVGETDPALVDFEMDLYWITKAGGDPLAYFASNPGRFKFVHVKDASPAPEMRMRDVGAGTIDWKKIFAQHTKAGVEHYFVEHDSPGADPFGSIKASYDYLAKLTF